MEKIFVSNVIGIKKIEGFKKGENYLIGSEMGSGKNYWVRNVLLPYAYENNMRVLILSSRTTIKEQQYNYLEKYKEYCIKSLKASTFDIVSYQKVENLIKSRREADSLYLKQFDFVVCDEAHYFTKDTSMNSKTVLSFDWINNNHDSIKIFMTATYESLEYLPFKQPLKMLKDANYNNNNVKAFYRYETQDTITPVVQNELDKNKKVLIVNKKKDDLEIWHDIIVGNVEDLLSSNKRTSEEYKSIIQNQKFNCDVLSSTSLICEGAEIFDKSVETVVINGISDLEDFVQTPARIRSNKVNVHYKRITPREIKAKLRSVEKQLFYYDEFSRLGQIDFIRQYGLDIIDKRMKTLYLDVAINPSTGEDEIILRTHTTNLARLKYEFDLYEDILAYGFEEIVLKKYFPNVLLYDVEQLKKEQYIQMDIIENYIDKKMFKAEQEKLINVISYKFGVRASNGSKKLGIKTINAFFYENNIKFVLNSDVETGGKFRKKTYWVLEKIA